MGARSKRFTENSFVLPKIPDCPDGGEIKTTKRSRVIGRLRYQTAPMGARSKRKVSVGEEIESIPDCPHGGEIKTAYCLAEWWS